MAMGSICMDTPASVAQVRLESLRSRTRARELHSESLLYRADGAASERDVKSAADRDRKDLSVRATYRVGSRQLP